LDKIETTANKMFNFYPNPEYVPGGINNFWISSPPSVGGQAKVADPTAMTSVAGNMDSARNADSQLFTGMFSGGFFTNSAAKNIEDKSEELKKDRVPAKSDQAAKSDRVGFFGFFEIGKPIGALGTM